MFFIFSYILKILFCGLNSQEIKKRVKKLLEKFNLEH